MKKKFILGIGSQRAGSTFITRLLNQHQKIAIHPLKELHYFDTIFGLRGENVLKDFSRNQLNREINKLCDSRNLDFVSSSWKWYLRTNLKLYNTPVADIQYFDLFSDIKDVDSVEFTGESTPEYMLLDKHQIKKMKATINNAYVIIICRNPVKRIISSFRLLLEYGNHEQIRSNRECDQLFLKLIEKDDIWIQRQILYGDYEKAIKNYSNFFNRVLFLSYDDIVESPQNIITNLSKFLDLDFQSPTMLNFFKRKINPLSIKYNPGKEIISQLETLLEEQNTATSNLFAKNLKF